MMYTYSRTAQSSRPQLTNTWNKINTNCTQRSTNHGKLQSSSSAAIQWSEATTEWVLHHSARFDGYNLQRTGQLISAIAVDDSFARD